MQNTTNENGQRKYKEMPTSRFCLTELSYISRLLLWPKAFFIEQPSAPVELAEISYSTQKIVSLFNSSELNQKKTTTTNRYTLTKRITSLLEDIFVDDRTWHEQLDFNLFSCICRSKNWTFSFFRLSSRFWTSFSETCCKQGGRKEFWK